MTGRVWFGSSEAHGRSAAVRLRLASLIAVIALAACAATPTTGWAPASSGETATPGSSASAPTVACLEGLSAATCSEAARVAVAAVAPSGWTPTTLWINTGSLCPWQECLFDPNQNFPAQEPPDGGRWVGSVEIAFAQSDEHAGLSIASVGGHLVAVLIGYRVPLLDWCSGTCPSAAETDGRFRLELVLPHLGWHASDPVSGDAILSLLAGPATTIYGSGSGLITFSFDEVGGERRVDGVSTADCGPHPLDPATPINVRLFKSGAVSGNEPDAAFVRSFLADPLIHLPAGAWDITATAEFAAQPGCAGATYALTATERIRVSP